MAHAFEKMVRYVRQYDDLVWPPTRDEIADYMLTDANDAEPYAPLG